MSGVFSRTMIWVARGFGLSAVSGLAIPSTFIEAASASHAPASPTAGELPFAPSIRRPLEPLKPLAALPKADISARANLDLFVWPEFVPAAALALQTVAWPPFVAPAQIVTAAHVVPEASIVITGEDRTFRAASTSAKPLAGQLAYVQKINVPTSRRAEGRKPAAAANRPKQRDADATAKRSPGRKIVWLAAKAATKKSLGADVIDIDSRRRKSASARSARLARVAA